MTYREDDGALSCVPVGSDRRSGAFLHTPARSRSRAAVQWLLCASAIGMYLSLFLRTLWRIGDEGSIVYGAQRVAEGEIPYRDFFEVMGPGAFYWMALWFKVLGISWLTSRAVILMTALGSAWAIYYATSRHCRRSFALFPAAVYTLLTVPLWPGASHHFDSNMWVLLAVAASIARDRNDRIDRGAAMLAGVLAAVGATIMPQKGVLVLAALTLSAVLEDLPRHGWRRALARVSWMIGPFAAVGLTVLLFFWSQNALTDLLYANVTWPAAQYRSVNGVPYAYGITQFYLPMIGAILQVILPFHIATMASVAAAIPIVFVAGLPFIVGGQALYRITAGQSSDASVNAVPLSYWCASIALFASECHRADMVHLSYGSPLLLVVATIGLDRGGFWLALVTRRTLVCSVALVAVLLALFATSRTVTEETRRGHVRTGQHDEALEFLQKAIRPGEPVFIYPYYPMYYFLANVRNPTRYSILMYHINTLEQFDEVIQALESRRVEFVFWDTLVAGQNLTQWFPEYRDPPRDQQRLERYLERRYKQVDIKGGFRILQRNAGSTDVANEQ
jgi:hypothetical protein